MAPTTTPPLGEAPPPAGGEEKKTTDDPNSQTLRRMKNRQNEDTQNQSVHWGDGSQNRVEVGAGTKIACSSRKYYVV